VSSREVGQDRTRDGDLLSYVDTVIAVSFEPLNLPTLTVPDTFCSVGGLPGMSASVALPIVDVPLLLAQTILSGP